jgi:hypothetical protein
MCSLIFHTPCSYGIADVPAHVFNLGVIAHSDDIKKEETGECSMSCI